MAVLFKLLTGISRNLIENHFRQRMEKYLFTWLKNFGLLFFLAFFLSFELCSNMIFSRLAELGKVPHRKLNQMEGVVISTAENYSMVPDLQIIQFQALIVAWCPKCGKKYTVTYVVNVKCDTQTNKYL